MQAAAGVWIAASASFVGAGCRATEGYQPGREWIEVSSGVLFFERRATDGVDDALGWRIGGGYDFNVDPVRVSWEIEGQWATHDVDLAGGGGGDLAAWTLGTGLRLTADLGPLPLAVYGRAGVAWHQEAGDDDLVEEQDGSGEYLGCGLEWRYAPGGALGPSVQWFRGDDDQLRTRFAALTARFRF